MCNLNEYKPTGEEKELNEGYKVFRLDCNGKLWSLFEPYIYNVNEWNFAKEKKCNCLDPSCEHNKYYSFDGTAGFYVYTNIHDAVACKVFWHKSYLYNNEELIVKKVQVGDLIAVGFDSAVEDAKVLRCKKLKIIHDDSTFDMIMEKATVVPKTPIGAE